MDPTFFPTPAELRAWFLENHATSPELVLGYHKVASGLSSVTWQESVDQALCFGWIDGKRQSLGAESYKIRFTPRREGSRWSAVNVRRMRELLDAGLVAPAGRRAFDERRDEETAYAYEQRHASVLDAAEEARFRADDPAWAWFSSRPPSYRNSATFWVVSAKRPETRERRLGQLIADSAAGRKIAALRVRADDY